MVGTVNAMAFHLANWGGCCFAARGETMKTQSVLVVSMLMATVVLTGCALVTPTPPAAGATASTVRPDAVAALEAVYGPPSQAGFGSAVFYDPLAPGVDLEQAALARYQFFVGDLWERYGADAWMGPWQRVYSRPAGAAREIVAELRALAKRDAAISASVLLDSVEAPEQAQAAMAAAFDDPAVAEVTVYTLGDGGAMAGLLVAGQRQDRGAIFLVFLLD